MQVLVECSYVTAQVVIYTIITYFMVGFELTAAKFFYVLFLVWLCSMVAFCTSQVGGVRVVHVRWLTGITMPQVCHKHEDGVIRVP